MSENQNTPHSVFTDLLKDIFAQLQEDIKQEHEPESLEDMNFKALEAAAKTIKELKDANFALNQEFSAMPKIEELKRQLRNANAQITDVLNANAILTKNNTVLMNMNSKNSSSELVQTVAYVKHLEEILSHERSEFEQIANQYKLALATSKEEISNLEDVIDELDEEIETLEAENIVLKAGLQDDDNEDESSESKAKDFYEENCTMSLNRILINIDKRLNRLEDNQHIHIEEPTDYEFTPMDFERMIKSVRNKSSL